ncbi:ChaN family lipoprotein [Uliginosibacterium sediminicola]|uniref:ChaN family lipoprotein n=1 Tax=Uliginosibacterium sediminicola TaxID=2024550 RepID=A0ABU9Z2Z9_9RHOO
MHRILAIFILLIASACSSTPALPPRWPEGATLSLLGEVHDNAVLHAQRTALLRRWVEAGARPAILMEQFDREQQSRIDALRQRGVKDAELLIREAGQGSWQWPFYKPVLELALQYDLPIIAANVSRSDARRVMVEGLAAAGFDAALPTDILSTQARLIEQSHCGALDTATAQRMALAQIARDQFMARQLSAQGQRPAVLLAGNGHVRRDIGVPRWLGPAAQSQLRVFAWVEAGAEADAPAAYDIRIPVPAQARPDPCEAFRKR